MRPKPWSETMTLSTSKYILATSAISNRQITYKKNPFKLNSQTLYLTLKTNLLENNRNSQNINNNMDERRMQGWN